MSQIVSGDDQKQAAAEAAVALVENGMKLGLGTGSTAARFVDALSARIKAENLEVICVPTSEATRQQAQELGIPLTTLNETPMLDLTIDGADELDDQLRLIKGGGGALLREKIVAVASKKMVVIADASKKVSRLGVFPLPVEVVAFGVRSTFMMIEASAKWAGCEGAMKLRMDGDKTFVTDNGNLICDCHFEQINDAEKLLSALSTIPGVVEHGLFINIAKQALIGTDNGVETLNLES